MRLIRPPKGMKLAPTSAARDRIRPDVRHKPRAPFCEQLEHRTLLAAALVSVNAAGTDSGNHSSSGAVMSADGSVVAFISNATNLSTTPDTNATQDIYARNLQTGTTALVSVNAAGTDSGNGFSESPAISADGRFVVFKSDASDLVPDDTNATSDIFVRDLQTQTTTLVSANHAGTDSGDGQSSSPVISANGRFVAFLSRSSDLTAFPDSSIFGVQLYVRDLETGTTALVSVNAAGTGGGNDSTCDDESISSDGRFVAFQSAAYDLAPNDSNGSDNDVYLRDMVAGTTIFGERQCGRQHRPVR